MARDKDAAMSFVPSAIPAISVVIRNRRRYNPAGKNNYGGLHLQFSPIESAPDAERENRQEQQLSKLIRRVYQKTVFYQERMAAWNLQPSDIQGIGDLKKMPFMNQTDLAVNYPFGLLTMPVSGLNRLCQEKNGEGLFFSAGFTQDDLKRKTEAIGRILLSCGITTGSVLMFDSALPPERSLSLRQAAECLGATVVSAASADASSQVQAILDFGVTTIVSSPEAISLLFGIARQNGIDRLPLQSAFCEVHQCHEDVRAVLEEKFQIPVFLFYGRSDIMNVGIAGECYQRDGLHIQDDCFIPEIIDPDTGELLDEGKPGELVLTTLFREGMPLIRYRTGDIVQLIRGRCICDRTMPRLQIIFDPMTNRS
ncbi:MAG: hypothetical protein ABFC84_08315 [Veillonellales bacterium]